MAVPKPPNVATALYVISVAAELAGVHPQTLRIYERKGLVDPARTRGGSRRYSDEDIALLRRIQELTTEGLNLAGVQRRARARGREPPPARDQVATLRADVEEAVAETHRQYRRDIVPVQQAVVLYQGRRRRG